MDQFTRRKPRCSKCGLAMAGHKRPDGSPICPSPSPSPDPSTEDISRDGSFLHTPPPSPPGSIRHLDHDTRLPVVRRYSTTPTPSPHALVNRDRDPFNVPEKGPFHRRNPNWVPSSNSHTITTRNANNTEEDTDRSDSTVLVDDDGKTIRGSDLPANDMDMDMDDGASVSSDFFAQLGARMRSAQDNNSNNNKRAIVTLFATQRTNPSRSHQLAAKQGMHAGLVKFSDTNDPRYGSWWMAVGRDPKAVYRVMSGTEAQTRMPGAMEDLKLEGPRLTTFLQLLFVGLVAGSMVLWGVAYV